MKDTPPNLPPPPALILVLEILLGLDGPWDVSKTGKFSHCSQQSYYGE